MTNIEKNYLTIAIYYLCDGDLNARSNFIEERNKYSVEDMILMNMIVTKNEGKHE